MALGYLLDTNICIYIARHRPLEVVERFRKLRPGDVGMSAVTYGELCYGACKSRHRDDARSILKELAQEIPVLALGPEAGDRYGEIRAELERLGRVIGNNDLWIAAHALALQVVLVTNNEGEFVRVPGLRVQNWAKKSAPSQVHEKEERYSKKRHGSTKYNQ
jgi:tRNA(fMet)-specific endonuclease VapC